MEHLACFADRLKELLEINGLDVKDISEATEIDKSNLYNFLDGKHIPSTENAIRIAMYFQCPLDYLFGFCESFEKSQSTYSVPVKVRYRQAIDGMKCSRYKLSQISKICQQTLWRWYHGRQTPNLSSLVILSEFLDCSVDFLAGKDL